MKRRGLLIGTGATLAVGAGCLDDDSGSGQTDEGDNDTYEDSDDGNGDDHNEDDHDANGNESDGTDVEDNTDESEGGSENGDDQDVQEERDESDDQDDQEVSEDQEQNQDQESTDTDSDSDSDADTDSENETDSDADSDGTDSDGQDDGGGDDPAEEDPADNETGDEPTDGPTNEVDFRVEIEDGLDEFVDVENHTIEGCSASYDAVNRSGYEFTIYTDATVKDADGNIIAAIDNQFLLEPEDTVSWVERMECDNEEIAEFWVSLSAPVAQDPETGQPAGVLPGNEGLGPGNETASNQSQSGNETVGYEPLPGNETAGNETVASSIVAFLLG